MPGAFKKSIKERGVESSATAKIKHAMFHDLTQLPFKPTKIEEQVRDGMTVLYFESKAANTTDGDDALEKYREGIYDNHSIGFSYLRDKIAMVENGSKEFAQALSIVTNPDMMKDEPYAFIVDEVKLYEYSTVGFGANDYTPFLGFKTKDIDVLKEMIKDKITKLYAAVKSGRFTDETFIELEIQCKQLEQIMYDLTDMKPTIKDTLIEPLNEVTNVLDINKFNQYLTQNF
jgi:phage head maturation protease